MLELKLKIKESLVELLSKELQEIETAALNQRAYANQDDLKSEGKYDTRAIEASYMAQAQEVRLEELKLDLQMIKELEVGQKSEHIELGCLAKLKQNNQSKFYFLSSALGGTILNINGQVVLVISVFSPIGSEALNLSAGDMFELETPKETKSFLIEEIF